MAYLWGKYERKANYRTEKRLARNAFATQGFATARHDNGDIKLYPDLAVSKRTRDLVRGDIVYVDKVDTRGSIPDAHVVNEVTSEVAKIINLTTMDTYYCDYRCDFYKIEEIRVLTGYSKGSYITDVESSGRYDYPDNGEKGGYFYVYKGIDNQAPTISGRDEDLGDKNAPFKQSFTVNDSDSGNTLKVTVRLNSAIIQTIENANRNETYTINIDKEKFDELTPNKQNTITVTVDDGQGASANRRWVFTKRNTPPTVSVDQSNLGEQNKPFSFSFTPNDVDGDEITGKVFLDEVQIEDLGTLTRGQSKKVTINKLDFAVLKNGDHRIRIEVTDSKGAKGYGHIDFSKNLTYCWYEFKKDIEGMATSIIVNPSVKLASGAKMTVKVCNNAKDREPVWETIPSEQVGKAYSFRNKNKTADTWSIGVNIRIDRSKAKEDSYFYGFVGNYQ